MFPQLFTLPLILVFTVSTGFACGTEKGSKVKPDGGGDGSTDSGEDPSVDAEAPDVRIQGAWTTDCDWFEPGGTLFYSKVELDIADGQYQLRTSLYETTSATASSTSPACVTLGAILIEDGTYSLSETTIQANQYPLDLSILSRKATVVTSARADELKAANFCAITTWGVGTEVDLLGKQCEGAEGVAGQKLYTFASLLPVTSPVRSLGLGRCYSGYDGLTEAKRCTFTGSIFDERTLGVRP